MDVWNIKDFLNVDFFLKINFEINIFDDGCVYLVIGICVFYLLINKL